MAINVSVSYNDGFLPYMILLSQCYYHWGTRLNAVRGFVMIPPKHFDIFSLDWGMLKRSIDAFRFFLKHLFFPNFCKLQNISYYFQWKMENMNAIKTDPLTKCLVYLLRCT